MARWLGTILSVAIVLAAAPASARISVADYLESLQALQAVETVPETQRASYMQDHAAELARATQVQEQAATSYETLLAADEASFARFRRNLLCNFIEEDQPITFKMMMDEHIAELRDEKGLDDAAIARELRYTDFSEVLVDKMLDHYECPAQPLIGPEAASIITAPAR